VVRASGALPKTRRRRVPLRSSTPIVPESLTAARRLRRERRSRL